MKKYVIKYLPIGLALLLTLACFITLTVYDSNFAEYAVVSFSDGTYEIDMKISESLNVINVTSADGEAYQKNELIQSVKGMKVDEAVYELRELLGTTSTLFVSAVAQEESGVELETLKQISETAVSELEGNYISAYAYYADTDATRVDSMKTTLGKIAWTTYFIDVCEEQLDLAYFDSYLVIPAEPCQLAYYVNYLNSDVIDAEKTIDFQLNTDAAEFSFDVISEQEATDIIEANAESWYGEEVNDFTCCGIVFTRGKLQYEFSTFVYGYESFAHVNVITGEVLFDSEGY